MKPSLSRNQPPKAAVGYTFDYLDDVEDEYGTPASKLMEPYVLTAFELDGHDSHFSLDDSRAWETVPASLAEHSISMERTKTRDRGVETKFTLEAAAAFLPNPSIAAAARKLKTHVYVLKRHRPKLWTVLPQEPPESVRGDLLKTTLRCQGSVVPQSSIVRCDKPTSAWDVSCSRGKPLEIDLGGTCEITDFSTQGRAPNTRLYPHVWKDKDTGQWLVEDSAYGPDGGSGRYAGPWFTVKATRGDPTTNGMHIFEPAWVGRYELLWRTDGGRAWNSLGVLRGNTDATTEVAHSFATVKLRARYLRIVPLDPENGGAMRVGVYGRPLATHGVATGGSDGSGAAGSSSEGMASLVTYTHTESHHRSTKFGLDGQSFLPRTGRDRYRYRAARESRSQRSLRAKREANEAYT